MSWESKKLEDLATVIMGQSPPSKYYNENGDGMPFFQGKTEFGETYPSTRQYTTKVTRLAKAGYILFTVRAPVGDINIANIDCCIGRGLAGIEPYENNKFLFYLLKQSKSLFLSKSSGAIYDSINKDDLRSIVFQVPSAREEREKIASILSAYDDLIENNTRRIAILEEMAQMIYQEWFVKFRFPGHEKMEMVDSPLGKIPEGWEVKKITDAMFINPKTSIPKEGKKPFLSMTELSINSMVINGFEFRDGNSGSKFAIGDTLFARITPCLENGKTGFVYNLPIDYQVAFGSTEFIVLRSKTLCPQYVYLLARSNEFRGSAIKSMTGATGRQRVQETCFDKFLFAHPDLSSIKSFEDMMDPCFHLIHNLNKKNKNLRQTRDLILPKLISGKLDVSDLDIEISESDEPELQASAGGIK